MHIIYYLIAVFISFIPGIYAALFDNFVLILNRKNDCFLMRAAYTVPSFSFFTFVLATPVYLILILIKINYPVPVSINDISCAGPFVGGIALTVPFIILIIKKYMIAEGFPFEMQVNFFDYDYYVYLPDPVLSHELYMYVPKKKDAPQSLPYVKSELKSIEKHKLDILSSIRGEIVISENVLCAFYSNDISGFVTKPLVDSHKPPYESKKKFFQMFSLNTLPPVSPKTKILNKNTFIVTDDKFIYDSSVQNKLQDINCTSEIAGYYERYYEVIPESSHLLIISQKTVKIMIEQFNVSKRDFLPVYFDSGISDS